MAKRKNRAATETELGLITDIQPDARMTDHHEQHSNANKAIIDLYEALDIDIDGGTGDIILGADFGNNVPDPTANDSGKVLATDGSDYGWVFVDSQNIKLSNAGSPFGISDDPNYAKAQHQSEANALFVRYITENEEAVKALAAAIGINLEIDADGNITIELPGGGTPPTFDDKFDVGAGTTTLNDATVMEAAIDANTSDISLLVTGLGGDINNIEVDALPDQTGENGKFLTTDGSDASWADVPKYDDQDVKDDIAQNASDIAKNTTDIAQNTTDIANKFDKDVNGGVGPSTYTNAKVMEDAITNNAGSIASLDSKIDGVIDQLTGGDATIDLDITSKLDRGDTNYKDAKEIEDAIVSLDTGKSDVNHDHDATYATKDELSAEAQARIDGDAALDARVSTNEGEITTLKTEQATQNTAIQSNTDAINALVIPDVSDLTTKDYVDAADATKFDKGATTYADAKAMEDAIKANTDSITTINNSGYDDKWIQPALTAEEQARIAGDSALQDQIDIIQSSGYNDTQIRLDFAAADAATLADANAYTDDEIAKIDIPVVDDFATTDYVDAGDATTLSSSKTYTDEEVAKIFVPDVSDLATKDELTTGLAGKADESHTHDDLAAGDHNHDSDYSAVDHDHDSDYSAADHNHDGDYVGKTEFDAHTHDTTHNHDTEYQPVGDYATNDDLTNGLATKSDTTHNHDADYATKDELAVVDGKADANTTKNAEQDGKIAALESANESLDNKVEALENALISAKYKVEIATGKAPREGYVRLDDADPNNIALMVFNPKDANGNQHDFSGVKDGDKLTVATNSAVGTYNILSATTGSLSVTFISGNGTFALDDVIDVKVSPEFDASSYATTTYVDAQDATKFDKGATGPTTYTTAELMEAAINTNKDAINANADVIDEKYDAGVVPNGESRTYDDAYALEKAVLKNATDIADIDPTDTGAVHTLENTNSPALKCTGIMALTQAEYDALDGSRNPEVLYLVVG